jgi:hypothetical protein
MQYMYRRRCGQHTRVCTPVTHNSLPVTPHHTPPPLQALAAVGHVADESWGEDLLLALRPQLPSLSPADLVAVMAALASLQVGSSTRGGGQHVLWVGGGEGAAAVGLGHHSSTDCYLPAHTSCLV